MPAIAVAGAVPAQGGGGVISHTRRQFGELVHVDYDARTATVRWRLHEEEWGDYDPIQELPASLSEIRITDGMAGVRRLQQFHRFCSTEPEVEFQLSRSVPLPPPGAPLVLPPGLRAMSITGPGQELLLVEIKGRLSDWQPYVPGLKRGGWGRIKAFSNGASLTAFCRYDSLMDEGGLPHAASVRPVVHQAVLFTARASPKGPTAHQVRALDGGPIQVVTTEPVDDDDDFDLDSGNDAMQA